MEYNTFEALGNSERFQIIELLRKSPYSVNEISNLLNLRQPNTSKHLKILADAGVVDIKKIKQKHYYNLNSKTFKDLDTWIQTYKKVWEQRLDRLEKVLKEKK